MPSITGLTAAEVEARRAAGQTNQPPKSQTKTTGEIVRDNVCTYFNLVFLVLAVMLALVHSWLNMGFLGIVFWNTLIGIVQQLRAKRTIDKLTLVSAQKLRCLRDGRWCEVLSDGLPGPAERRGQEGRRHGIQPRRRPVRRVHPRVGG